MALSDSTINERVHRYLKQQAQYSTSRLAIFDMGCDGCKSLYHSLLTDAGVPACYTSIGLKKQGTRWHCPDCNRLIADEDDS